MSLGSTKIVVLGESSVGKSSILMRYSTNNYKEHNETTIGAAFISQTQNVDDQRSVKFEIWDTAGQERFRSLTPMYYREALGALVVYDITSSTSFDRAIEWVEELERQNSNKTIIILVGNKLDLKDERAVPYEQALEFATNKSMKFFEASAKDNTNVKEIFREMALLLLEAKPKTTNQNAANINSTVQSNSGGSGCCN